MKPQPRSKLFHQSWSERNFEFFSEPLIENVLKPWRKTLTPEEQEWGKKIQLRIMVGLKALLRDCEDLIDTRDALPEWVAEACLEGFPNKLPPRGREPGWTLTKTAFNKLVWEKLLDDLATVRMSEYYTT